ncbi:MAG TPA: hypothetical protein VK558_17390 [Patescibacteria group bacterium]|nr:hypothetical protein [Patescibacteria group bacterium]
MADFSVRTVFWTVVAVIGLLHAGAAHAQQGQHCPNNPKGTATFFEKGKADEDKDRIAALGAAIKDQQPLCILAFTDPSDTAGYSRKLAVRRVLWVRDNLVKSGVPLGSIAVEFRPGSPDQDKDALRLVQVIQGR